MDIFAFFYRKVNAFSLVETLKTEVENMKAKTASVESFLKLIEQHSEVTELTPEIARMFMQKILILIAALLSMSINCLQSLKGAWNQHVIRYRTDN